MSSPIIENKLIIANHLKEAGGRTVSLHASEAGDKFNQNTAVEFRPNAPAGAQSPTVNPTFSVAGLIDFARKTLASREAIRLFPDHAIPQLDEVRLTNEGKVADQPSHAIIQKIIRLSNARAEIGTANLEPLTKMFCGHADGSSHTISIDADLQVRVVVKGGIHTYLFEPCRNTSGQSLLKMSFQSAVRLAGMILRDEVTRVNAAAVHQPKLSIVLPGNHISNEAEIAPEKPVDVAGNVKWFGTRLRDLISIMPPDDSKAKTVGFALDLLLAALSTVVESKPKDLLALDAQLAEVHARQRDIVEEKGALLQAEQALRQREQMLAQKEAQVESAKAAAKKELLALHSVRGEDLAAQRGEIAKGALALKAHRAELLRKAQELFGEPVE
jgi:hypothetical protein